jgi:hypothetical protein
MLSGAIRIAADQVPHRDFYANYGPAQFVLLAFILKHFSYSIWAARIYDLIIRAGICLTVFSTLRTQSKKSIAVLGMLASVISLAIDQGNPCNPIYPTILLTLWATFLLGQVCTGERKTPSAVLAGLFTGMVATFRYDVGLFLLVANTFSFVICKKRTLQLNVQEHSPKSSWIPLLIVYVISTSVPISAMLFGLWSEGALKDLYFQVFESSLRYYSHDRSLPFPGIRDAWSLGLGILSVYVPLLCLPFSVASLLKKSSSSSTFAIHMFFSVLVIGFFVKGSVRVSPVHMQMAMIPAILLLAMASTPSQEIKSLRRNRTGYLIAIVFLGATFISSFVNYLSAPWINPLIKDVSSFVSELQAEHVIGFGPIQPNPQHPNSNHGAFWISRSQMGALLILKRCTSPTDRLFSGISSHDRVFVNDNLVYYLSGLLPATKWSHFDPSLQTSLPIQTEMVGDLEKNRPPILYIDSQWQNVREPNGSSKSSGVKLLDNYIANHYKVLSVMGNITLLYRNGIPLKDTCRDLGHS